MLKRIVQCLVMVALISGGISHATVTIYATRLGFDLDCPGLPIEDFEEAAEELLVSEITDPYEYKYRMENGEVLYQHTDNGVFVPGDILPGIEISSYFAVGVDKALVVLGVGADHFALDPSSVIISNSSDEDSINMIFPEGIDAVAFDLFYGGDAAGIKVYGADDILLYDEIEVTTDFVGIHSTETIFRVRVEAPYAGNGHFEAVDNIAFGTIDSSLKIKFTDLLDFYNEAVDADTLNGRARGWRGNIQLLSVYWNLRFAAFFYDAGRELLACRYLRIAERQTRVWLIGDATTELLERIRELKTDLDCPRR